MIGIITQPLEHNYGGILQAYALQKILRNLGYKCETINLSKKRIKRSFFNEFLSIFVRLFKRTILDKKNIKHPFSKRFISDEIIKIISKNTFEFVNNHIVLTEQIVLDKNTKIEASKYNCFIVGSDQVWRPKYNYYQPFLFLDFLNNEKVKRIAYAASFGVDENEYPQELLKICKPLAQKFDSVSVREDSGVRLCKELFDVEAVQVIDPTMFFDSDYYINISKERNDYKNEGDCFTYILDKNDEKQRIIDKIINKYDLKVFNVMSKYKFTDVGPKLIEDCVMPPVEQWLDGFNKAKFVITDSFHGCVFSIIFKKPFIVIGNKSRGMARFDSLLRMFKLENRLIHSENDLTEELLNSEIDFDAAHEILAKERQKAVIFLKRAIESKK